MLLRDQNKAYRGLGLAHKNLGNLQEALVRFKKNIMLFVIKKKQFFFV